jgi:N-acetylmuramoyl-L-alanine amidase
MFKLARISLLLFLFNTLLFSGVNTLNKAVSKNGELHLFFSKPLSKTDLAHFGLNTPHRIVYDFKNTHLAHAGVASGLPGNVRISQHKANMVRVVIEADKPLKFGGYQPFFPDNQYYITLPKQSKVVPAKQVKIEPKKEIKKAPTKGATKPHILPRESVMPIQSGSIRAKLIVIDAGHGGKDAGAVSGGKKEKDVVLQIAKKLEKELKKRGHPVHMTRTTDRFLTLPQRTKIADQKGSAVFISIHANAVSLKQQNHVQGIETFFLQKTRDAKSKRIAERENKSVLQGTSLLSRNIILDSVLSGPKIVQSNKLAIDVQRRMLANVRSKYGGVKDGGVRHAPFWVLVGASRPSILVEVGYISHPTERQRLFNPQYQDLLAKGIAEGVDIYLQNRKKEIDF